MDGYAGLEADAGFIFLWLKALGDIASFSWKPGGRIKGKKKGSKRQQAKGSPLGGSGNGFMGPEAQRELFSLAGAMGNGSAGLEAMGKNQGKEKGRKAW